MRILRWTMTYQAAALAVLSGLCLWFWPARALAVLLGGLVMLANFWALRTLADRALRGSKPKAAAVLGLGVKLIAAGAMLALFVLVFRLDVLGLALGMSSLFFGIGMATVHGMFAPASADGALRGNTQTS